ncbi:MAG TPA: response regulator [Candidatus Angelobacter sp.]|nr:response regulator [Candidatus Angelobacter sp.]
MSTKSKTRILVVEDDATVRLTISKVLEAAGYDVSAATDGFDALLHLQQAIPDLILSDLNMPQMSGFELLSVVRRRFPEVLVVASSGAYDSSAIPDGVIADAFYAKGQESAPKLLEIIAGLIRIGPTGHRGETAPVWIPRNGKDHNGKPFVVLTCTQCLRSFPFTVDHEPAGEVLTTPCIYCPHEVNYIIDFSRSVNSPEKRAAWKAAFLKSQKESAETTLSRIKTEMAQPRIAQSARDENQKRRTDWLRGPIDH